MARLEVLKTYKIYIGGAFPRTESGRYYVQYAGDGKTALANVCLSSRKDLRNAVVAARSAVAGWSGRPAFNRGQILYRMAEMLEGRSAQFADEMVKTGLNTGPAKKEVEQAVDTLVYYAGWCDKYQQVAGSVNPVSSSHFNFSVPEPTGVVCITTPPRLPLSGLVHAIAPVICGGNTCVVLANEFAAMTAVSFAEVIHASDLPGGVVNILTGKTKELLSHMASHMDVNALALYNPEAELLNIAKEKAAGNVKRVFIYPAVSADLQRILDLQEIKTTWHPIENIGGGGSKY